MSEYNSAQGGMSVAFGSPPLAEIRKRFSEAISAFNCFRIPDDSFQRVGPHEIQLAIEHKSLLAWSEAVGIRDAVNAPIDAPRVTSALTRIAVLLRELEEVRPTTLRKAHEHELPPADESPVDVSSKILESLRKIHIGFESLLDSTSEREKELARSKIASMFRETVIKANGSDTLRNILEAIHVMKQTSDDAHGTFTALSTLIYLLEIKEVKSVSESAVESTCEERNAILDGYLRETITVERFSRDDISGVFAEKGSRSPRRPSGLLGVDTDKEAWLEERTTETRRGRKNYLQTLIRSMALAQMLSIDGRSCLLSPNCIGYVDHDDAAVHSNNGWIFEVPPGTDPRRPLVSLHDLLDQESEPPSLTKRVNLAQKLASAVLHLHVASWVHKAVHSGNVLFPLVDGKPNFDRPILSGFEYSRPYRGTVRPVGLDEKWDIYRWPGIQNEVPRTGNTSKLHDIYAFGLLLLEIGHWKMLPRLVKLRSWPLPSSQSLRVRGYLLEDEYRPPFEVNPLSTLRRDVGDKYWTATRRCIQAVGESGMDVKIVDELVLNLEFDYQLHATFEKHVLQELQNIRV